MSALIADRQERRKSEVREMGANFAGGARLIARYCGCYANGGPAESPARAVLWRPAFGCVSLPRLGRAVIQGGVGFTGCDPGV
jgi:hypothetical protein